MVASRLMVFPSIAIDRRGNVYTANYKGNSVTKISVDGIGNTLGTTDLLPRGIAVDSAGNVYTANSGSTTVTRITASGNSSIIPTPGTSPRAVALDGRGSVFVSDNSGIVIKITARE